MKYSICIDAVFGGIDSLAALPLVKAAGFDAFEFWDWRNRDITALKEKADSLGLVCVCFVGKMANLTNPKEHGEWLKGIAEAAEAAAKMGCSRLIATAGEDSGSARSAQHNAVVDALKAALPILAEHNLTLLLEPLNGRVDHIGTYLETSAEGFEIIDKVGSKHIKMLFDIYHQQITEGDIIRGMKSRLADIAHIHSAGVPGRHELDTGELNYRNIFDSLDEAGYSGYAGIEYFPTGDGLESLKRLYSYLQR